MTESDHGKSAPSASQRPTLEVVDDAALQFTSVPPTGSSRPSALLDRATLPGSSRASWSPVVPSTCLPFGFELRLLVSVLRALTPIHTNLLVPPHDRVHGQLCHENFVVDPDGSVRLRSREASVIAPGNLQAPEAIGGAVIDQQADLYSVGMLAMAAVERSTNEDDGVRERVRAVAARAVRLDPQSRWPSALEFALELERAAEGQLPTRDVLAAYLRRGNPVPPTRASVTSIPDSEVELLEPEPEAASAPWDDTVGGLDRAPVSFDPRRMATSLIPEEAPRRRARWLWLSAVVVFVGGAAWAFTRVVEESDAPLAGEARRSASRGRRCRCRCRVGASSCPRSASPRSTPA